MNNLTIEEFNDLINQQKLVQYRTAISHTFQIDFSDNILPSWSLREFIGPKDEPGFLSEYSPIGCAEGNPRFVIWLSPLNYDFRSSHSVFSDYRNWLLQVRDYSLRSGVSYGNELIRRNLSSDDTKKLISSPSNFDKLMSEVSEQVSLYLMRLVYNV